MTWSALSRAAFKVDTAHWYQRSEYISKPSSDAVSSAFWWALPWCAEQNLGNSSFQIFSAASRARMGAISARSEEHTSELQSLMRTSYAVFCLKKKKKKM